MVNIIVHVKSPLHELLEDFNKVERAEKHSQLQLKNLKYLKVSQEVSLNETTTCILQMDLALKAYGVKRLQFDSIIKTNYIVYLLH